MSKAVTIRNVPDDVLAELAARASRDGRSLQEYLRAKSSELAARPDITAWLAKARADRAGYGVDVTIDEILAARDDDRR